MLLCSYTISNVFLLTRHRLYPLDSESYLYSFDIILDGILRLPYKPELSFDCHVPHWSKRTRGRLCRILLTSKNGGSWKELCHIILWIIWKDIIGNVFEDANIQELKPGFAESFICIVYA